MVLITITMVTTMTDAHKQLQIADLDLPPKRGRPKSGNALSNAEKQREYRNRLKASGSALVTLNHEELSIIAGLLLAVSLDELWRIDMVKKAHATQLDPLREKITAMGASALDKAFQAVNPPPRKVRK